MNAQKDLTDEQIDVVTDAFWDRVAGQMVEDGDLAAEQVADWYVELWGEEYDEAIADVVTELAEIQNEEAGE